MVWRNLQTQGKDLFERIHRRKDGSKMPVEIYSNRMGYDGQEYAFAFVQDITDRKQMEEMMIQSEKMLSVGGLAAGMAHETNDPLAGILQNTAVLENRLLGDLPANRRAADAAGNEGGTRFIIQLPKKGKSRDQG